MYKTLEEAISSRAADALLQTEHAQVREQRPWPAEPVSLGFAAGRVLAQEVLADRNFPPFDRIMMDGFICHADDLTPEAAPRPLTVLAQALLAGTDPRACALPEPGQCLAVATGAAWPPGACRNTWRVIPIEEFEHSGRGGPQVLAEEQGQTDIGGRKMMLGASAKWKTRAGQHLHPQGSDRLAQARLLEAGSVLGPLELALCATVGLTQPLCRRKERVQILTTGSEIVRPDHQPLAHQIRASHPAMLAGLLSPWGECTKTSVHVPDCPTELRAALICAAETADVVLLTGGVSRGQEDFTRPVLDQIGARILLHRVQQRPGFPFLCARIGSTLVFGLPGNPLSVLCCAARYVVPWLKATLMGRWPSHEWIHLPADVFAPVVPFADGTSRYVALARGENGEKSGLPLGPQMNQNRKKQWRVLSAQNSGDLVSWTGAEGIAELTAEFFRPEVDGMIALPWYPFRSSNGC